MSKVSTASTASGANRPRRFSPLALGALAASCYTTAAAPPPTAAPPPAGSGVAFTILPVAVGPLTSITPVNLVALRAALPGYEVKPAHLVLGEGMVRLGYNVYQGGEPLLHVIPDDTGHIRNIHALSPKVVVADRPWQIGQRFNGAQAISVCKCWEAETVVCFKPGDHVAVAFSHECSYDSYESEDERQDLIGLRISRVLWSPKPYTKDSNPYGGTEYGGDDEYGGLF